MLNKSTKYSWGLRRRWKREILQKSCLRAFLADLSNSGFSCSPVILTQQKHLIANGPCNWKGEDLSGKLFEERRIILILGNAHNLEFWCVLHFLLFPWVLQSFEAVERLQRGSSNIVGIINGIWTVDRSSHLPPSAYHCTRVLHIISFEKSISSLQKLNWIGLHVYYQIWLGKFQPQQIALKSFHFGRSELECVAAM